MKHSQVLSGYSPWKVSCNFIQSTHRVVNNGLLISFHSGPCSLKRGSNIRENKRSKVLQSSGQRQSGWSLCVCNTAAVGAAQDRISTQVGIGNHSCHRKRVFCCQPTLAQISLSTSTVALTQLHVQPTRLEDTSIDQVHFTIHGQS